MAFLQCSHLSLRRRRWKRDGLIGKRERMYWVFLQCVFSEEKKEVEDRKLRKREMYWLFSSECVFSTRLFSSSFFSSDRKLGKRGDVLGRCSGADEGHR